MNKKPHNIERSKIISDNINYFCRHELYPSFEDIARELKISSRQLSRYMNNECDIPATTLYDLAEILDVDIRRMVMTEQEWLILISEGY